MKTRTKITRVTPEEKAEVVAFFLKHHNNTFANISANTNIPVVRVKYILEKHFKSK